MANRLVTATSPYLLQHADNPVEWWEWGDDAFAEARRRDLPVFLSVGYAACHWCHEVSRLAVVSGKPAKPQVSGLIAVRAGRANAAVGHRFRSFVHHSRASLKPVW
jgi:hypothetical protein